MIEKRFEYHRNSQSIVDKVTGHIYQGNKETCDLLNRVNSRADTNAELLDPFMSLMKKYEIDSIEKLDKVLLEQRVW